MSAVNNLVVLMFHHVHGSKAEHLHALNGVKASEFELLLKKLQYQYQVISTEDLIHAEYEDDKPKAIITFDDGTVDNYLTAFPILKKLGLPATFFLISKSTNERWLASVQKRHLLRNVMSDMEFSQEFSRLAPINIETELEKLDPEMYQGAYRWDTSEVARFKYYVNFAMPFEIREEVLTLIFEKHVGNPTEWGDKVYLNWGQIKEMQEYGMVFGGHSHYHEALGMLPEDQMEADIRTCSQILSENLGSMSRAFSYPFGKKEHFSEATEAVLAQNGFHSSYLNVQGINDLSKPHLGYKLFRLDPKDVISQSLI